MADTVIRGFPQSDGAKIESVLDHIGPASYTQVSTGATVTGGDVVSAAAFGLKWLDYVDASMDSTGVYTPLPIINAADPIERTQVTLRWMTASGATEAAALANLSSSHVRLRAVGW
jgi:hypothetical protein